MEKLFFVTDLLPGGDLGLRLADDTRLSQKEARFYTAEISLGLAHLHSLGFIHRDVKPENILLDARGHCCLADLGLVVKENATSKNTSGTPGYMAPEVFQRDEAGAFNPLEGSAVDYNRSVDFWSLGCVLYQMIVGTCPFRTEKALAFAKAHYGPHGRNLQYHFANYATCTMPVDYDSIVFFGTDEAKLSQDLCAKLLTRDPAKRFGSSGDLIEELKVHPWFVNNVHWESIAARSMKALFVPKIYQLNAVPLKSCLNSLDGNTKFAHVDLTEEDQKQWEGWEYTSSVGRQAEIVEFLQWSDAQKTTRRRKSTPGSSRRGTDCRFM